MARVNQYQRTHQKHPRPDKRNVFQKFDSKLGSEEQKATLGRSIGFPQKAREIIRKSAEDKEEAR